MKLSIKIKMKTKIIISFVLLIVFSLGILGTASYHFSFNALQNSEDAKLHATVSQICNSITDTTKTAEKYLELASDNNDLAIAASNGNAKNKLSAHDYLSKFVNRVNGLFEWVYITDTTGKDICDNQTDSPDKDLSDRDYVKDALNGNNSESNEVLKSKMSGKPIIGVAYPLTLNGKVVGVLGGTILFNKISSFASDVKIGKSGYAYIVDKNGLIVYHPDENKVLNENISDSSNNELKKLAEIMKSGKSGNGFYTDGGIYKYIRFQPADKWIVVVTAPYTEYMAATYGIANWTIFLVLLFILLTIIVSTIMAHKIVTPIKYLEKLMRKAGDGDISVHASIKTNDELEELGDSFNNMIKSQSHIVSKVRDGAKDLVASAEGIAASSEQISTSSEEVNASMQEVSANTEVQDSKILEMSQVLVQLSSLIQLAQNKAKASESNSIHASEAAQSGRMKVQETVDAMNLINDCTNESDETMGTLEVLSKKIEGIIITINAIAEQTNMLALNAAIEAARAGESGKGFTIVAEQIRKLSEQSNSGANEISVLINEMTSQTKKAVISMKNAKEAVDNGVNIANETDKSFISIINTVEGTAKHVGEIVKITSDEVATSDQIVTLIDSIASTVESNDEMASQVAKAMEEQCACIEDLAATAQQTDAMSVSLEGLVEKFKVME